MDIDFPQSYNEVPFSLFKPSSLERYERYIHNMGR